MSVRNIVGKSIFNVVMDVCVEYVVIELVSEYRDKGLAKVYYCKKYSKSRFCKGLQICLRHVCEESVCGMVGSEAVLGRGEWDVWCYVL